MAVDTVNDELLKLCRLGIVTSKELFRRGQDRKDWYDYHGRIEWHRRNCAECEKDDSASGFYRRLGLRVLDFARACSIVQHYLQFNNVNVLNDYDDGVLRYILRTPRTLMAGLLTGDLTDAVLLTWVELLSTYASMVRLVMFAVSEVTMEFGDCSVSKPCRMVLAAADSNVEFRDDWVELSLLREGLSVLVDADAEILLNSQNACIHLKLANRTLYGLDQISRVPHLSVTRVTSLRAVYDSGLGRCTLYADRVPRSIGWPLSASTGGLLSLRKGNSVLLQDKVGQVVQHTADLEIVVKGLKRKNERLHMRNAKLQRSCILLKGSKDRQTRKAREIAQHLDRYYNDLRVRQEQGEMAKLDFQLVLNDEFTELQRENVALKLKLRDDLEGLRRQYEKLEKVEMKTRAELRTVDTRLVESQYKNLETKFDRLRADIQAEREQHTGTNATLTYQNLEMARRLQERQNEHACLKEQQDQLQADLLRLQQNKHDERERLTSEIDSLRLYLESSATSSGSSKRRRHGHNRPVGAHHSGSQIVLRQEERYRSVLSLASDRVAHDGKANPSYKNLPG